jgi:hypothetical protein
MTPSNAKVLMADVRKLASANATDAISTKTSDASATKASHVTSTKATHMASAKASHAPATVSSAPTATAAAAGLCPRGKKAAGKHGACQNHHHSSSHDILHLDGRTFRHRSGVGVSQQSKANVAMDWRWKRLFVASTKFAFIWFTTGCARTRQTRAPYQQGAPMDTKAPPIGGAFCGEATLAYRHDARGRNEYDGALANHIGPLTGRLWWRTNFR